jgi:hypothetical protein
MPAVSSPVLSTKVLGRLAFHKEIGNPGEPFHPCPAKAKLYFVVEIIRREGSCHSTFLFVHLC